METITEMDLARLVFGADEMKCESRHRYVDYCSGEVAYINEYCTHVRRVCRETVETPVTGTRSRIEWSRCEDCKRRASDCWTIRPI